MEELKSYIAQIILDGYNNDYIEQEIKIDDIGEINIFNDLNYDSIQFIQLIVQIEETFNIEIPDDMLHMEIFSTISQITCIVENILNNTGEDIAYDS